MSPVLWLQKEEGEEALPLRDLPARNHAQKEINAAAV